MPGSRFTVVDPSMFTSLDIVKVPDKEGTLRARMEMFKSIWLQREPPLAAAYDVEPLEFDPAKVTMEAATTYEASVHTRVNQAARSITLAFATGRDLDGVASRFPGGVPRLPSEKWDETTSILERRRRDERYRYRIWLSPFALASAGTTEGYVFHALTAVPEARDASATVIREGGEPIVVITLLMEGSDPQPSAADILNARQLISSEEIWPLSDDFRIRGPGVKNVVINVKCKLYPWADWNSIKPILNRNFYGDEADQYDGLIARNYFLGYDLTRLELDEALSVNGIHSVVLEGYQGEVISADDTQIIRVDAVDFEFAGVTR